jgi:hypothetical protein
MNYSRPVLLAAALVIALAPERATAQGGPQGDWELTINTPQDTNTVNLSLQLEGDKLTGKLSSRMGTVPVAGTSTGGTVALTARLDFQGNILELGLDGKIEGDSLNGTVKFGDFGEFPFTGKRAVGGAVSPAPAPAPSSPAAGAAGGGANGVEGKWNVVLTIPGVGEFPASATFTQDAAGVVGGLLSSAAGDVVVAGTLTGTALKVEFKAVTPQGEIPVVMTGDLTSTGMSGKASIVGLGEADWTATRVP